MITEEIKGRLADYFEAWELVEVLAIPVEDVIEQFEDEIDDKLDDILDIMNDGREDDSIVSNREFEE